MRQRARKAEDKQERRRAIEEVARSVWSAGATFASFNMAEVAERAGLAKGTLYLYFASKESLLLALLADELWAWFDEIDALLAAGGVWTPRRVAQLLSATLARRDTLTGLLTLLETILEHNIEYEEALSFKTTLKERMLGTGARLEQRLSFLRPGTGARLLLQIRALMAGIRQMSSPAPVVARVLQQPGMEIFKMDFGEELAAAALTLLLGAERAVAR